MNFYRLISRSFASEVQLEKRVSLLQRVLHIRKVARVNSGGKIRSTSALVVVGDQNGHAGYGMGRGKDTATAVQKAIVQAQKNMDLIPRLENRTIHADMDFKFKHVQFKLRNAKPGI
jgi:small subunit ribosomal protein S5